MQRSQRERKSHGGQDRRDYRGTPSENSQPQQPPIAVADGARVHRLTTTLSQRLDRRSNHHGCGDDRQEQRSGQCGIPRRDRRPLRCSDSIDHIGQGEADEQPIRRWTESGRVPKPLEDWEGACQRHDQLPQPECRDQPRLSHGDADSATQFAESGPPRHRPAPAITCCTQNSQRAAHDEATRTSGDLRRPLFSTLASSGSASSGSRTADVMGEALACDGGPPIAAVPCDALTLAVRVGKQQLHGKDDISSSCDDDLGAPCGGGLAEPGRAVRPTVPALARPSGWVVSDDTS